MGHRRKLKVCVLIGCMTPREMDAEMTEVICEASGMKNQIDGRVRAFIRSLRRACEFEGMRGEMDADSISTKAVSVFCTTI